MLIVLTVIQMVLCMMIIVLSVIGLVSIHKIKTAIKHENQNELCITLKHNVNEAGITVLVKKNIKLKTLLYKYNFPIEYEKYSVGKLVVDKDILNKTLNEIGFIKSPQGSRIDGAIAIFDNGLQIII